MKKAALFLLAIAAAVATAQPGPTPTYLPVKPPMPSTRVQSTEYHTTSMNGPILQHYWQYLHSAPNYQGLYLSAGMDVVIANDSLWEGDWTNSNILVGACSPISNYQAVPQYSQNRMAEQIRITLQAQYGYGGTGLMPAINIGQCGSLTNGAVNPELYTAASPSTVATTNEIGPQDSGHGYYSVVQMSAGQTLTWNGGGLPYTFARIYCADDTTSNAMAVTIDGVSVGSACGTHNATPIARVFTTTPNQPFTNHSLVLTCTSGHCLFYGAEGRPSTGGGNAGVRVHNLSVGSVASGFFVNHWEFENLISNGTASPSAQLVIYAMGTNDASYGVSLATYKANFQAAFAHYQAETPEPSAIVIYRPGLDSVASQSYFNALTAYGYANNLLVIDQTNRWGTSCSTACWWLGNDNVHVNDPGNLDASHTILNALTDVVHGQPITPLAGDTGLNAGVYRVTAPPFSGSIGVPGYSWDGVPGIPSGKGIYGFQTGNGANLPGVIGLFDPTYLGMLWMTNANNDFCVHVPTSGANFSTCAGKNFRIVKATGEVDTKNNVLDDGSGNESVAGNISAPTYSNTQSVTVTTLAAAGSGGSFTAFACTGGTTCTPNYGSIAGTLGTAPTSGDIVKLTWSTGFNHKAMCVVNAYDGNTSAVVTTYIQNVGGSSSTQATFLTSSAPAASHSITINYACL